MSPKNFGSQKLAKFGAISNHFSLWPRMSQQRIKISTMGRLGDGQRWLPRSKNKARWTLVH